MAGVLRVVEERRIADVATVVAADGDGSVAIGAKMLIETPHAATGTLGDPILDRLVVDDARKVLSERKSRVISYRLTNGTASVSRVDVFHEVIEPQPQLLIVGAGHIAVPLARFAKMLGFEVLVVDDREKFANVERFPEADRVTAADFGETLSDFPFTPSTHVVIITRAHTYDEEALRIVLKRPHSYLGVIGSRRRVQTVLRRLAAEGFDRDDLAAIRAPIGLDIGAELPEEIALAIIAEVVAARRGGSGAPLSRAMRAVAF